MFTAPLVLALALTPAHGPAALPSKAVLGTVLRFKKLREFLPAPPPPVLLAATGIEVTVGPLPSNVGGPPDEALLRGARLGVTADDAITFFRLRMPPGPARATVEALVRRLGGEDIAARDAAQKELVAIGPPALPLIREAVNNIDEAEAATRARQIVAAVDGPNAAALVIHNARILAARKPAAAAEVLLGYLPFAEDNASFQECEAALVAVALPGGKADPAVLKALKDRNGIRRGTAAQVLSQVGGPAFYPAIRPLLKDALPSVRLRVALGLVGAHDGEAVPVLIDLIGELPASLKPAAEEYLNNLAGEWAVTGPKGHDVMSRKLRRDVWQGWWKNTDGSTLLEEFRSRTPTDDDREKIDELIKKLDSAEAGDRDGAHLALVGMGKKAASQLRRAAHSAVGRAGPFALKALEAIEKDEPNPLPSAAARLLALRKPDGAVETLLGYLAVAESEEAYGQLVDILASVAVPGGKADETLVKALRDKSAPRRAAAAVAICRGKATAQYALLRKMLDDKDPVVRLRIGEGLATVGDKIGVSAIIAALKDLPLENAWDAEELLHRVAGDKAPSVPVGADADSRGKAVEAWAKWWKENEAGTDLAKVEFGNRESGNVLFVEQWNPAKGGGRVLEVDRALKPRWEITGLQYPNHAQLLRNGNVLIVEQQNRVTERDKKGKIVWDKNYGGVLVAERLPDGNTFLGCHNALLIVDKDGKNIFSHYYNINTIAAAKRFRDGSMAYVSYSGHYVRLDKAGKQVKTFNMPWGGFGINGAEILPNDRCVVSVSNFSKVIGYNADGKQAWEVPLTNPLYPTVTPSGNVIVSGDNMTRVVEIDRRGKIVKEMKGFDHKPYRVVRR